MTTLIKLKAEIDNENLPILNDDGTISNYFVGRFKSALSGKGYTLPSVKETALNAFIEDGISKGWIDYVDYMLPFIGNSTTPKAGFVPLIDRLGNYVVTDPDETDAKIAASFHYDDGDIVAYGASETVSYRTAIHIPLPYSRYKGLSYMTRMVNDGGINCYTACFYDEETKKPLLGVRKSPSDSNVLQLYYRNTPASDATYASLGNFYSGDNYLTIGFFAENGSNKRTGIIRQSGQTVYKQNLYRGNTSQTFIDQSQANPLFCIGKNVNNAPTCYEGKLYYWLAVNPDIPKQNIFDLDDALTALCSALGR